MHIATIPSFYIYSCICPQGVIPEKSLANKPWQPVHKTPFINNFEKAQAKLSTALFDFLIKLFPAFPSLVYLPSSLQTTCSSPLFTICYLLLIPYLLVLL